MKRFWSYKVGQRFWIGTSIIMKTSIIGCSDCFGNLYIVLPWSKFTPFDAKASVCECAPSRTQAPP